MMRNTIVFPSLAICLAAVQSHSAPRDVALIYRGPGACAGCPEAAAQIAERAGLEVRYIGPEEISLSQLNAATVYVQPGGEDSVTLSKAVGRSGMQALRDYVDGGGRYWGLCAGGYFAGAYLDDNLSVPGLGLFAGDAYPHSPYEARTEQITWQGRQQVMYTQEAPGFELAPHASVDVIATYSDGEIAAFQAPFGTGWVALSGPHPEATQEWLEDEGLTAPDLASTDLAVDMLRRLIAAPE